MNKIQFEYTHDTREQSVCLYVNGRYCGLISPVAEIRPQRDWLELKNTEGHIIAILRNAQERKKPEKKGEK